MEDQSRACWSPVSCTACRHMAAPHKKKTGCCPWQCEQCVGAGSSPAWQTSSRGYGGGFVAQHPFSCCRWLGLLQVSSVSAHRLCWRTARLSWSCQWLRQGHLTSSGLVAASHLCGLLTLWYCRRLNGRAGRHTTQPQAGACPISQCHWTRSCAYAHGNLCTDTNFTHCQLSNSKCEAHAAACAL